jgi:hypothetical protein
MLCRYSQRVEYVYQGVSTASVNNVITIDTRLLDDKDDLPASVLVHEGCHNMMRAILGGRRGLSENDVERPCERMQYMFLYRSGYYKTYLDMVSALKSESYGRDRLFTTDKIPLALRSEANFQIYKNDASPESFCSQTKLHVKENEMKDDRISLTFTNAGSTTMHCGLVELMVNDKEYPLDCFELAPGKSYTTDPQMGIVLWDKYMVRQIGCGEDVVKIE